MNFSEKSCKKWLISWKIIKNHRFNENWQLFEQTITFRAFHELFGEMLQKVAHFVENHEKLSIWPNLGTFRTNYHVSRFGWTFRKKVAKSGSSREKPRKIIDLNKTSNLSSKLSCFYEIFGQKFKKVAHFVKNHEKSSIWPKLATFRANYYLSRFRWTFRKKVAKSGSFREKPSKMIDLTKTSTFSINL